MIGFIKRQFQWADNLTDKILRETEKTAKQAGILPPLPKRKK